VQVTDDQFSKIRNYIRSEVGIFIPDEKRGLVAFRLRKIVERSGAGSFGAWLDGFLQKPDPAVVSDIADAISTNHTFFNRENAHFDYYARTVLPEIVRRQGTSKKLRVWCAASSTGQEPYTLASIQREAIPGYAGWDAGLLATDISSKVLEKAASGYYSDDEASDLPSWVQKYFARRDGGWQASPEIHKDVLFRRFNLITPQYPFKSKFQVIFCRNVMMYFDPPTMTHVVDRMYDALEPGGYFFIGLAESLRRVEHKFDLVEAGVFRRR